MKKEDRIWAAIHAMPRELAMRFALDCAKRVVLFVDRRNETVELESTTQIAYKYLSGQASIKQVEKCVPVIVTITDSIIAYIVWAIAEDEYAQYVYAVSQAIGRYRAEAGKVKAEYLIQIEYLRKALSQ